MKTKEDAELQKLQLITEFEMSNCQRLTSERENELKIKQQREEVLFKRYNHMPGAQKNFRFLSGHEKLYSGPIFEICDLFISKDPELDSRVLAKHFPVFRAISEFLKICRFRDHNEKAFSLSIHFDSLKI